MPLTQEELSVFQPFPKVHRLNRRVIITEKIDGTNAQVIVYPDGTIRAASKSQFLEPGKKTDNFGFAHWVRDNTTELLKLGVGRHYGEWWGLGIQRGYGLFERRFSLFNVARWSASEDRPNCCHVVPILIELATMDYGEIESTMKDLKQSGSFAAPGFNDPEGIVIHHTQSCQSFKWTYKNDEEGKSNG